MKKLTLLIILIVHGAVYSQSDDKIEIQNTIEAFFKGFHQQDSLLIKENVSDKVIMQTISNKDGNVTLITEDFNDFLKSIISIPKDKAFEEKLMSYHIQVDGEMAQVWTPYEFYFDGAFSHCGVNSFQLLKQQNQWKIIYLIDTRRKGDCAK